MVLLKRADVGSVELDRDFVSARPRVVVFARQRAYVSGEFADAARALDVELIWATDRCHVLAEDWPDGAIPVDTTEPEVAAETVARATDGRITAAIGTDEQTAELAAALAQRVGIRHHGPAAAARAGDKLAFRQSLTAAGCRQPRFEVLERTSAEPPSLPFPVVIKPRCLSASRGVMRADTAPELADRMRRLWRLLSSPEIRSLHGDRASSAIVESFVSGPELAYEGMLGAGAVRTTALFDKPDPLDGPFFAESLYVTPSQHPAQVQAAVVSAVRAAAAAIGITDGPIHAELRLGDQPTAPVVIELAARSIGGLCGRTLRFASGHSVETIVLADLCDIELEPQASRPAGVLMLQVPEAGVLIGVDGLDAARALPGVEDIVITVPEGHAVLPLPEGNEYLGFAFASSESADRVTEVLREVGGLVRPRIRRQL